MDTGPSIVLGVTSDESVHLLRGFPGYLADRGWTVHVVSARGPLSDQLRASGVVRVHWIDMERRISLLKDLRALLVWLRLLIELKPDVVYVGTPKAGLLGGLAGWLSRIALAGLPATRSSIRRSGVSLVDRAEPAGAARHLVRA